MEPLKNKRSLFSPRNLLLLDGFGAMVSAIMVGLVLPQFENQLGIPSTTLQYLGAIPIPFIMYDGFGYSNWNNYQKPYLLNIAILNFIYCGISLTAILYHSTTITHLGYMYFLGEIALILLLVYFEWNVHKKIISK